MTASTVQDSLRLIDAGHLDEALAVCEGLRDHPEQGPDALHVLGLAAAHRGESTRALDLLAESVRLDPGNLERRFNLGALALELGRPDRALDHLFALAEAAPSDAMVHTTHAQALGALGRHEEAIAAHERAIALAPKQARLWSNLAAAYLAWGKVEAADAGNAHALSLEPGDPDLLVHLGGTRARLGHPAEAMAAFERALALDPHHTRARTSLGVLRRSMGALADGLLELERAVEADPADVEARFNLAIGHLYDGRFRSGFALYEARRERMPQRAREGWGEAWDGSERPSDTLYVDREQGLGDTLMFARFLAAARERVRNVVLLAQPRLVPLLKEGLRIEGVEVEAGGPEPPRGLYAPLMSLPHLVGLQGSPLSELVPYLVSSPERVKAWAERLGPRTKGPRLGLVWQGNPKYPNDGARSIPLTALRPLLETAGVEIISLQQVDGLDQLAALPEPIRPLMLAGPIDAEGAFLDTAAILESLDLVISTDTATIHLAGALGIPSALLLGHVPDWRWGQGADRWYPAVCAFRQAHPGDWVEPVTRLVDHVRARFTSC